MQQRVVQTTQSFLLVAALCAPAATAAAQDGAGLRLSEPSVLRARPSRGAARPFSLYGDLGLALDLRGADPNPIPRMGAGVSYQLVDGFSIGMRSLTFGFTSVGEQLSFRLGGNLYVEPSVFVDPRVQLYAQLGVTVIGNFGPGFGGDHADVFATLRGGARFWLTDWLTLGVEAGFDVQLTERVAPWFGGSQGDLTPYAGITVGFHW